MKQSKIFEYYSFGYDWNNFVSHTEEATNKHYSDSIKIFEDFSSSLDLPVTRSGIEVHKLNIEFNQVKKAISEGKGEETISKSLHNKIQAKLKKIDSILDAELSTKYGYILDEKRYSNQILTSEIEKMFSTDVYFKLPSIAQFDFKESGLCLAFDRFTASSYHLLRGIEDVLKYYYSSLTGIAVTESDTWFKFTKGIEDKTSDGTITPAPPEELMTNLNNLRRYYRNKTQHPDKIYSLDETLDLFGICTKTVNEIIGDLSKRGVI